MCITLESVPWTNQYKAKRVKFLAQGNNQIDSKSKDNQILIRNLLVKRYTQYVIRSKCNNTVEQMCKRLA